MARRKTDRWHRLRTWRSKLLLLLLAFSVIPPVLLTWWHYAAMREAWEASTLDTLQALARAKGEAIDQFILDRRSEVERIASLMVPEVAAVERTLRRRADELPPLDDASTEAPPAAAPPAAVRPAAPAPAAARGGEGGGEPPPQPTPPSEALAELRQSLGLILYDQSRFEELMVIDGEGRVIASTHEAHEGRSAADLGYFRSGLGATHLEPVFESPITGELTTIVATPIRHPERGVLGVLAARLNLERFFRLVNDVTGLGESGETVVGKQIDGEIVFMAPTRHDAEAALRRRVPVGAPAAQSLQEATRGQGGTGVYEDYRERRVLAAWQEVPTLEWGLVVKMDRSEALAPVRDAAGRMLVLLLLVVAAGVAAAVAISRAFVRPLKELKAATERISRGDFDVQLDIRSDDEVGELAASFERMVAAIKFFRAHSRRPEEDPDDLLDEDATLP
jgi:HAMP domain-containing protein